MMKNNKLIATCIIALLIVIFSCNTAVNSFADQWKRDEIGWWYQHDDGSYPAGRWLQINGLWYYFGHNGYLLQESYTPKGYYVNKDGVWMPKYLSYDKINLTDVVDIDKTYLTQYTWWNDSDILLSIGTRQESEEDGVVFAQIGSWYGILSQTYYYGDDGICMVFDDVNNSNNTLVIRWYGIAAINYPEVIGYGECAKYSGGYSYYGRIGEGMQ